MGVHEVNPVVDLWDQALRVSSLMYGAGHWRKKKQWRTGSKRINYQVSTTPRTAHELDHLSYVAQASKTYADELPPTRYSSSGGNMCSSCSSYSSYRGQMSYCRADELL